jgi:hypothetical protein
MEISRAHHVRNEEVLLTVREQTNILHEISKGGVTGLVTFCIATKTY